jgi:hypothetical protein
MVCLPDYFDFGVLSLLFVKINYGYIAKYERLPKPKTSLGLGTQPLVDNFFPFVRQVCHLFIVSAFDPSGW